MMNNNVFTVLRNYHQNLNSRTFYKSKKDPIHIHVCARACSVMSTHKSPLSMGFSGEEYCSGLPFPSQGDFPDPGSEPTCLASSALAGGFFTYS